MQAAPSASTVFVVDDDAAVRDGLAELLESDSLRVETFESAEAFLKAFDPSRAGCAVLDIRMPAMSGLALQEELHRRESLLPVIFLTAFGDIPMTVTAMQAGAVDFLTKPVDGEQLLDRIHVALALNLKNRERAALHQSSRDKLAQLTARERDVLALAIAGHQNKEIARLLGISFRTVEVHRSRILLKTGMNTLLGVAHLAAEVGDADANVHAEAAGSRSRP